MPVLRHGCAVRDRTSRTDLRVVRANTMKDLLFTPEMARAVCQGRKTVTRRVIVPQPKADMRPILMDSINLERGHGWASNPWVWRVEFKEVAP